MPTQNHRILDGLEKFLLYTGVFFTVILLLQVILTLIGIDSGGSDIDVDFDVDFDDNDNDSHNNAQFSIFSFKSLVSFCII